MAFSGLSSDACTLAEDALMNTTYFGALMDSNRFVRCRPCRHQVGLVGATTGVSSVGPALTPQSVYDVRAALVGLENDLRGQARARTRCSKGHHVPGRGAVEVRHEDECQMFRLPTIPEAPAAEQASCAPRR